MTNDQLETATLAGGCFWCLEPVFEMLEGVHHVVPGYTGGHVPHPSYQQVCSETTGHAEAVQLQFDPAVISYRDLLDIFFTIHDPTTPNRQGNDIGSQYRSAIYTHNEQQRADAEAVIKDLTEAGVWHAPIVTEVEPLDVFYVAEDYHHRYFEKNPHAGYCQVIVAPKVAKARSKFAHRLRA